MKGLNGVIQKFAIANKDIISPIVASLRFLLIAKGGNKGAIKE